jgi:hypothetical protein
METPSTPELKQLSDFDDYEDEPVPLAVHRVPSSRTPPRKNESPDRSQHSPGVPASDMSFGEHMAT